MRKENKFDRKHVAQRLLNILNSDDVSKLYGLSVSELVNNTFPLNNDGDIAPQYTKKNENQAMDDLYDLAEKRRGKMWGVLEDLNSFINDDTESFYDKEREEYKWSIIHSPVNSANYLLRKHAQNWIPLWLNSDVLEDDKLTQENVAAVKVILER